MILIVIVINTFSEISFFLPANRKFMVSSEDVRQTILLVPFFFLYLSITLLNPIRMKLAALTLILLIWRCSLPSFQYKAVSSRSPSPTSPSCSLHGNAWWVKEIDEFKQYKLLVSSTSLGPLHAIEDFRKQNLLTKGDIGTSDKNE